MLIELPLKDSKIIIQTEAITTISLVLNNPNYNSKIVIAFNGGNSEYIYRKEYPDLEELYSKLKFLLQVKNIDKINTKE